MQAVIKRVGPYIEMPEFNPTSVAKVSKACKSICQWVQAMYVYHNIALQVEPKRQALAAAQAELDETNKHLAAAQASLQAVQVRFSPLICGNNWTTSAKSDLKCQIGSGRHAMPVLRCFIQ